jgi:hypothetical protein
MPSTNSIENLSGQFTETDWNESFSLSSPNKYSLSRSKADVTLVGDIEYSKLKSCTQYLLGYSYVGNDSNKSLCRITPAYHPIFTWLYAQAITDISCKGLPSDKTQITEDPPYLDTFRPGKYARAVFTVTYAPMPFNVLEDDQVTGEWQRYTELKCTPYSETLTIPNGQLLYNASYYPSPGPDGKPVISPLTKIKQSKVKFEFVWHEVPMDYICDTSLKESDGVTDNPNYMIPTKLLAIQKCVNSSTFLGQPAGTLLCEDVKIERGVFPVATDVLDQNMLMATVTFTFIKFDPPRHPSETTQGWNLLPWSDGRYYPTKIAATSGATGFYSTPYATYNFEDAFKHWSI